jgi:hypothetical protein
MRTLSATVKALTCALFILALSAVANAQMTRTWVSRTGDDSSSTCSTTAPCRTFTGALLKTLDKGEIDCLDSGSFGTVSITKNITIDGKGTMAAILATNTNGVVINDSTMLTPQSIVVVLRNLSISGGSTGLDGIRFLAGKALQVEHCVISGFGGNGTNSDGIDVALTAQAFGNQNVKVTDTIISNNTGNGIRASNTGTLSGVLVTVDSSHLDSNANGILTSTACTLQVANSYFVFNTDSGLDIGTGTFSVDVDASVFESNSNGIKAEASTTRIGGCRISGNFNGINFLGGTVQSFGDNKVKGNYSSDQLGGAVTPVSDPVKI